MQEQIAKKIKALRQERNLSMNTVSKAIGYKTYNGYRKVERGETELSINALEKIAEYFDKPIAFFFDRDDT